MIEAGSQEKRTKNTERNELGRGQTRPRALRIATDAAGVQYGEHCPRGNNINLEQNTEQRLRGSLWVSGEDAVEWWQRNL